MYQELCGIVGQEVWIKKNTDNHLLPMIQFFGSLRIEPSMNGHLFVVEHSLGNFICFHEDNIEKIDNSLNLELTTIVLK